MSVTSTASPPLIPDSSRRAALNGMRNFPPIGATVERNRKPLTSTRTAGRFPRLSAATAASGTSIPVLFPSRNRTVANDVASVRLPARRPI